MRCPAPATERCADEQREVFANAAAQKIGAAAPLSERYHTCRSQYAFMSFRSAVVFLTRKWTVKDKEKSQRVVSMESSQSEAQGKTTSRHHFPEVSEGSKAASPSWLACRKTAVPGTPTRVRRASRQRRGEPRRRRHQATLRQRQITAATHRAHDLDIDLIVILNLSANVWFGLSLVALRREAWRETRKNDIMYGLMG